MSDSAGDEGRARSKKGYKTLIKYISKQTTRPSSYTQKVTQTTDSMCVCVCVCVCLCVWSLYRQGVQMFILAPLFFIGKFVIFIGEFDKTIS